MRHLFGLLLVGRRSHGQRRTPASRSAPPAASTVVVWAVRWDWPDRVHEFIGPAADPAAADALLRREVKKWRRFPHRPELSVVLISLHDFWLHAHHRPDCKAPDCPSVDVAVPA